MLFAKVADYKRVLYRSFVLGETFLRVMRLRLHARGKEETNVKMTRSKQIVEGWKGNTCLEKGKPFNLTSDDDSNADSYLTEMQSVGFELNATDVRRFVIHIADRSSRKKNPPPPSMFPILCVLVQL
jgi:hypothetical protein